MQLSTLLRLLEEDKKYQPYMRISDMEGPYSLDDEGLLYAPRTPGVYLLGDVIGRRRRVRYVGRTGRALPGRLANWIGSYDFFYFRPALDGMDAFMGECEEFHRYGKVHRLDNNIHPARPKDWIGRSCSEWGCRGEAD